MPSRRQRVLVIAGSRPEAIKMAPVVFALQSRHDAFETVIGATGQQRELIPQALDEFSLHADLDLAVMEPDQSLAGLTARLLTALDQAIVDHEPDWILVQGDTTSAMAAALAGFYRQVRVGHVEAGMRTGDRFAPFPEEVNRRIITQCATLHFAATPRCRDHLIADGVAASQISVTGNTVVDALLWIRARCRLDPPALPGGVRERSTGHRVILVTSHRREHFSGALEQICHALRTIVRRVPDALLVYPIHPNPNVRRPVLRILGDEPRVVLLDPLPYRTFIGLMDLCHVILTDSGGLQEEAPSLGKPVLVLRDVTERTEGLEAGTARLVGTDPRVIVEAAVALMTDRAAYDRMATTENPYGDGHAAERIVDLLDRAGSESSESLLVGSDARLRP